MYVHASVVEPVKLYLKILPWNHKPAFRFGNTGWPCCTRIAEPVLSGATAQRAYVLTDFDGQVGSPTPERLWLIFTGRDSHWADIGRDESQIIEQHLYERGCQREREMRFAYEQVELFGCPKVIESGSASPGESVVALR